MKANFRYQAIEIGDFFRVYLDGSYEIRKSWSGMLRVQVSGLVDSMFEFLTTLLERGRIKKISKVSFKRWVVPLLGIKSNCNVSFEVPYELGFSGKDVYGDIFIDIVDKAGAVIGAKEITFMEYQEPRVILDRLTDVAIRFDLGLPAHMLNSVFEGDRVLLLDPKGNVSFWMDENDYQLKTVTLFGKLTKSTGFLRWLENVLVKEYKNNYKGHERKKDKLKMELGNFVIWYDLNEKELADLRFSNRDGSLTMVLSKNRGSVLVRGSTDNIHMDVPISWGRFGEKIWEFVKLLVF